MVFTKRHVFPKTGGSVPVNYKRDLLKIKVFESFSSENDTIVMKFFYFGR